MKELEAYFDILEKEEGWELVLTDFFGSLWRNESLKEFYTSWGIHRNSFCMKIKEDRILWDHCIACKDTLRKACHIKKKPFWGACYCGREELVFPIVCEGKVLAALSLGGYSKDRKNAEARLESLSFKGDLEGLKQLMGETEMVSDALEKRMLKKAGMAAAYLSLYFERFVPLVEDLSLKGEDSSYILAHALAFMRQNYRENLTIDDLSRVCHVSSSWLNHNFKKAAGISFPAALNRIRTDKSCLLLSETDKRITEIASLCGYDDPNYFSRVFSSLKGVSPRLWRQQKRG